MSETRNAVFITKTFRRPLRLEVGIHPSWLRWIQARRTELLEEADQHSPEGKEAKMTTSYTRHKGRDVEVDVYFAYVDLPKPDPVVSPA